MTSQRRAVSIVLALALMAAGCGAKSIRAVLADPAKYRNQTVTVRGTVDQTISIAGRGIYRIVDGDASLWVATKSGAPRKGAQVDVTGRLEEGFDLSAFGAIPGILQTAMVLVETSHKVRN